MVLQIANITKERPELFHLLEQAYNEIYLPAFPDKKERDSLETFMKTIDGKYPNVEIVVNILGENLEDPDNYVIKGIGVAYYYKNQNVGLLAYNAIDPNHREAGLGKLLVDSRIESLKERAAAHGNVLGGAFIECNDPTKVAIEDDVMDPSKRLAIFQKWGARVVPIDYIEPPIRKDEVYSDTLLLLNYPVDGKYAGKAVIEDYLRAIYKDGKIIKQPANDNSTPKYIKAEDDYFFRQMKKQLDAVKIDDIKADPVPGYKVGVPKFRFFGP